MRRPRAWHLLLALAALIVPLQAGALSSGEGEGEIAMNVSATLDQCGVGEQGIVCKIDISWSAVEGADSYSASVTGPDGAVAEMGTVGTGPAAGSASLWVPYSGDGVYSVIVTAWGEEDEDGNKPKLGSEQAEGRMKAGNGREPKPEQDAGKEPSGDDANDDAKSDSGKPAEDQPAPEPKPEPKPTPKPEPTPAPEPAPAPEPDPAEPAPAEPAPDSDAEAAPETAPESSPAAEPRQPGTAEPQEPGATTAPAGTAAGPDDPETAP